MSDDPSAAGPMDRDEITGKAYDLQLMMRLWAYVRPYRGTFGLSLLCLLTSSLALLAQPYILKIAIDRYMVARDLAGLSGMATLFIVAALVELLAFYGNYYLTMLVAQRALSDLRVAVFAHLQRLPIAYFDRNPVGRLVTRMTTDVDVMNEMFAAGALTIAMDGLTLLGIVAVLLSPARQARAGDVVADAADGDRDQLLPHPRSPVVPSDPRAYRAHQRAFCRSTSPAWRSSSSSIARLAPSASSIS